MAKTEFKDQSAEARKKRLEMPADQYGKMVDKEMGKSEGRVKGDFNEEPDTAKKYAAGGVTASKVRSIAKTEVRKHEKSMHGKKAGGFVKSADGCVSRGKTRGRLV